MTRTPLNSTAFALLILLCRPGLAGPPAPGRGDSFHNENPGESPIPARKLPEFTDRQFATLAAAAAGDQKRVQTVTKTQKLFNAAIKNEIPEDATYTFHDVKVVGTKVAEMMKLVDAYQKAMEEAKAKRENGDHRGAAQVEKMAVYKLTTGASDISAAMPMARPSSPVGGNNGIKDKVAANPLKIVGAPGSETPAVKSGPDLGVIVAKAVDAAQKEVNEIGGGGTAGGGTGSAPNGANQGIGGGSGGANGPASHAPTIGDLLGIHDPSSPRDAMTNARERYQGGDVSGAMNDVNRAISLGGGADALALRAGMNLDQKKYPEAYQDARQALQLDPANAEAQAVAQFSKGRGDASGSAQALSAQSSSASGGQAASQSAPQPARSLAPAAPSAAASRLSGDQARKAAENALGLGDTAGALAYANRALAADPNNPAFLNLRASVHARMKDYKHASEDAAAGLALAPKDRALLRTKAFADLRGGSYKDALGGANRLIELDPGDGSAFALRGHAYGNLGDKDNLLSDLNRAAELDPRFQEAAARARAGTLQLPSDGDILFLFPGEEGGASVAAKNSPAPAGRTRRFGLLVGVSAFGGLLLALGLLQTVLAPLKEKVTSAFTRLTRTGPSVASLRDLETSQPPSASGHLAGLIRGQYEVLRQIGQGGMGTVFEGRDRSLGRRVAIKKMREELRVNPQERARFVIEAKTVAALHHPSIVDIYSIVEDASDVYLVFEYVDGSTVHDLVQRAGRLPVADAARVVRAAADALTYAHSRGVVHRDMKPSNVMVDSSGRVKVMDFGIARMAKDAVTRYSMTNTVVGTPPYMAPEQEQGQVRRESDVYSLAVCAYEMLTGRLPFIGTGGGMLLNKINMSYVPPSRETAGLPAALDEVFAKAFQAVPESRYRTPGEFADALEAALPSSLRV